MIILVTPVDIPHIWEHIKKAVRDADEVREKDYASYFTDLLHDLLSSNAQCFIRMNEDRILEALVITRVLFNKHTNEKYLFVQSMFSWQLQAMDKWAADADIIYRFAKMRGCKYVSCFSRNPRVWELLESIGMQEETRTFSIAV